MIRILHFITDKNIGGAGNLLCAQIQNMNPKKFDITVALPHESELIKKLRPLPCKIVTFKHGGDRSFSLLNLFECYRIIQEVRPDIVHSHGSLSSRIASTILRIKSRIFTKHCAFNMHKTTIFFDFSRVFGGFNNLLSTSIIAVENSAKKELIKMGCNPKKITTIVNGAPQIRPFSEEEKAFYKAKYGLEKDDFVISYFARLEEYKGHKTLLEAAKICQKSHPNFKFFIVGNGSQKENLQSYAKALKIENSVDFIGFLEDVSPIFNLTNLNVNCSFLSETASLSISEGFSLGLPCVATNIGGNPYMLKNESCGLLFEAQNPNSLAQAICKLYTDKKLYKNCSLCASIRYAEELNDKIMTKKLENLYSKANQKES